MPFCYYATCTKAGMYGLNLARKIERPRSCDPICTLTWHTAIHIPKQQTLMMKATSVNPLPTSTQHTIVGRWSTRPRVGLTVSGWAQPTNSLCFKYGTAAMHMTPEATCKTTDQSRRTRRTSSMTLRNNILFTALVYWGLLAPAMTSTTSFDVVSARSLRST